ncbi:hypothetical protein AGMMS49992_04440 [Clostridia bacterium]|nr:hypothetical protein AGMMS49992_04440 [Clostridia bacterium]
MPDNDERIYEVTTTAYALDDLDEICQYIADTLQAPRSALEWYDRIVETCESLCKFPHRFPLSRTPLLSRFNCHSVTVGNFVVFYTIDEPNQTVAIRRILYRKRDFRSITLGE